MRGSRRGCVRLRVSSQEWRPSCSRLLALINSMHILCIAGLLLTSIWKSFHMFRALLSSHARFTRFALSIQLQTVLCSFHLIYTSIIKLDLLAQFKMCQAFTTVISTALSLYFFFFFFSLSVLSNIHQMAAVTLLQCLYHMLLAGEAGRIPIAEEFWEKKRIQGIVFFLRGAY